MKNINFLEEFRKDLQKLFYNELMDEKLLDKGGSEALALALFDISEAIETVYNELISKFLDNKLSNEESNDFLLDLKQEFNHILYHIEDAKLYTIKPDWLKE